VETETKPAKGKKGGRPLPVSEQPLPPWGVPLAVEVIEVPPVELLDSPLNTRRTYDEAKIRSLAAKIRRLGWRGRVLGRRTPPGIELIYGHRRKRGALLAGCMKVEVEIVDVDDATAWDLQMAENAEREDLHPLEEAEAFARRLELGGTVEEIADRIDRSVDFVRRRLQLAQLSPKARELFLAGRLVTGHADLLAALQHADQDRLLVEGGFAEDPGQRQDWEEDPWSVRALGQAIRHDVLADLAQAPWELHDAGLLAGVPACVECPKRSSAQGDLFPGVREDRCLDPGCFKQKREAFVDQQRERAAAKAKEAGNRPLLEVSTEWAAYGPKPEKGAPATADAWREVPAAGKPCEATQPALVVAGHGRLGEELNVCTKRTCKAHWGTAPAPSSGSAGAGDERSGPTEAEKAERKKELAAAKLEALVRRKTFISVTEACEALGTGVEDVRLIARVLWRAVWEDVRKAWAKLRGFEPDRADAEWRKELAGGDALAAEGLMLELALAQDLEHGVDPASERGDELRKAAKRWEVDGKAIVAAAKAELAPPKKAKQKAAKKAAKGKAKA
jgi:ParB/RepB/Spo0J family partition protein